MENISVIKTRDDSDRLQKLLQICSTACGKGVVFCFYVEDCERIAACLSENGIAARAYSKRRTGNENKAKEAEYGEVMSSFLAGEIRLLVLPMVMKVDFSQMSSQAAFGVFYERPTFLHDFEEYIAELSDSDNPVEFSVFIREDNGEEAYDRYMLDKCANPDMVHKILNTLKTGDSALSEKDFSNLFGVPVRNIRPSLAFLEKQEMIVKQSSASTKYIPGSRQNRRVGDEAAREQGKMEADHNAMLSFCSENAKEDANFVLKSMNPYLQKLYADLDGKISRSEKICDIRGLNYAYGNIPNYFNSKIQQFYILKYAYAYTYEYYLIYRQALEKLGCREGVNILSIGCGALTDYKGLCAALQQDLSKISYTGIDKVKWGSLPPVYAETRVELITGVSAETYLEELPELSADIYMFPKSISEISSDEVEHMAQTFENTHNTKEQFCICVSLRNEDGVREEDSAKADLLAGGVQRSGYILSEESRCYYRAVKNTAISSLQSEYVYPVTVRNGISNISDKCRSKRNCQFSEACSEYLDRYPILRTGEICYRILHFTRRSRV